MIAPRLGSHKDHEIQELFARPRSRRLPSNIQQIAWRKLRMLNNAHALNDLTVSPVNYLENLAGDRTGQYGVRINDGWRVY